MTRDRFDDRAHGKQVQDFVSVYAPKLDHIEQAWTCTSCDLWVAVPFASKTASGTYDDDTDTANCLICNLDLWPLDQTKNFELNSHLAACVHRFRDHPDVAYYGFVRAEGARWSIFLPLQPQDVRTKLFLGNKVNPEHVLIATAPGKATKSLSGWAERFEHDPIWTAEALRAPGLTFERYLILYAFEYDPVQAAKDRATSIREELRHVSLNVEEPPPHGTFSKCELAADRVVLEISSTPSWTTSALILGVGLLASVPSFMISENVLYVYVSLIAMFLGALVLWLWTRIRKDRLAVRCYAGVLVIDNLELGDKNNATYCRIHDVGLVRHSLFRKPETLTITDARTAANSARMHLTGLRISSPRGDDHFRLRMHPLLQLWIARVIEEAARLQSILDR